MIQLGKYEVRKGIVYINNKIAHGVYYSDYWIAWYKDGLLHRDNDLPAKIYRHYKEWYKNGKKHRDNKPAIEYKKDKRWYRNGELHRDNDLPAVIYSNGGKEWYKNGERYYPDKE